MAKELGPETAISGDGPLGIETDERSADSVCSGFSVL